MADIRTLDRSKKSEFSQELASRAASLLQSRRAPDFCVLSATLEILFPSPTGSERAPDGTLEPTLAACVRSALETARETTEAVPNWMPYRDHYVRVIPLRGPEIDCIAVFFDRTRSAASLSYAIRYYKFSKRESDVLGLLSRGYDTIEIARELSIAPSTARDHIVSMMRKTSSHRRAELLATALGAAEAAGSEAAG